MMNLELKELQTDFHPRGAVLSQLWFYTNPVSVLQLHPPPPPAVVRNSQPLSHGCRARFPAATAALQAIRSSPSAEMLRGRSAGFHASSDAK